MRLQSLLAALCLLAGIAAYALTPHQHLADLEPVNLEQMIPTQFGDWTMEPTSEAIIASPEQEAFVKSIYSQVLSRTYVNNAGERIMLSIAYTRDQSDNAGKQSHRPEICYPAQGFMINKITNSTLDTKYGDIAIKRMIASQGQRIEPLIYWTMVGVFPSIDFGTTKYAQVMYGLQGIIPDGLIFRVSMIVSEQDSSDSAMYRFIKDLSDTLPENAKDRLIGKR